MQIRYRLSDILAKIEEHRFICTAAKLVITADIPYDVARWVHSDHIGPQILAQFHEKEPSLFFPKNTTPFSLLKYWLRPEGVREVPELMEILQWCPEGCRPAYDCGPSYTTTDFRRTVLQYMQERHGDFELVFER